MASNTSEQIVSSWSLDRVCIFQFFDWERCMIEFYRKRELQSLAGFASQWIK